MAIQFGTNDGVWALEDVQSHQVGLAGKKVCHVATRDDITLAKEWRTGIRWVCTSIPDGPASC